MINRKIPLLDIHRHLDGNVRAQTILELGRQFNIALPADNVEALIPHVQKLAVHVMQQAPDSVDAIIQRWLGDREQFVQA